MTSEATRTDASTSRPASVTMVSTRWSCSLIGSAAAANGKIFVTGLKVQAQIGVYRHEIGRVQHPHHGHTSVQLQQPRLGRIDHAHEQPHATTTRAPLSSS